MCRISRYAWKLDWTIVSHLKKVKIEKGCTASIDIHTHMQQEKLSIHIIAYAGSVVIHLCFAALVKGNAEAVAVFWVNPKQPQA